MTSRWMSWLCVALFACSDGDQRPAVEPSPTEPELPDPPTVAALYFERIALNVGQATDFQFLPNEPAELLVLGHSGTVTHLRLTGTTATALDRTTLDVFWDAGCGLLSLAFDPAFDDNGFVYLGYCRDVHTSTLSRYRLGKLNALASSEAEIMTVTIDADPPEIWHRWGSLGFEPDGETMWALHGDMFLRDLAQDVTTRHGSLLRFRPNREPAGAGYEPAEGNAVDLLPDADPAVYAYGLRSPWRGYLDREGRYWFGDVGLLTAEEVDLVTEPGQNFGWPVAEGSCEQGCAGLTDPLLSFGRIADEPYAVEDPNTEPSTKRAVWLGVKYEAPAVQRYYGLLDDLVLYGDFFAGWVRGVKVEPNGRIEQDVLLGHLISVTSVRLGPDGYIYLLTLDGDLYRARQVLPD